MHITLKLFSNTSGMKGKAFSITISLMENSLYKKH
jgi:hypothetical protein